MKLNDDNRVIQLTKSGAVATIALNRPEKYNCWNGEMYDQLGEVVADISSDKEIRVAVVYGQGGNFSSGGDMRWYREQRQAALERKAHFQFGYESYLALGKLTIPVIAAIDGQCLMAGMNFATFFCDIRIASDRARFSFALPETGGEPIGAMGNRGQYDTPYTWHMSLGDVLYFAVAGGEMSADRAMMAGLIQEVVPADRLLSRAAELAERIANYPPDRIAASKALYKRYLEESGASFGDLQRNIEEPHVSLEGTRSYLEHTKRFGGNR